MRGKDDGRVKRIKNGRRNTAIAALIAVVFALAASPIALAGRDLPGPTYYDDASWARGE